ncbi:Nif3-like dinuclear metal center hexameric protein [Cohnella sp. GCM10027633]|uniref:Nif3-like dinuclear metal center hexameric protein n=1 Tax=unclassified Cohnella TaxID=2636738 RepID=UPI00362D0671
MLDSTITVQSIIDKLVEPIGPLGATVDQLVAGDPNRQARRVAVAFLASYDVIREAAAQGADLIITHEPTFYLHNDETEWLGGDPVYEEKRRLIEESGIAIFRFHDYVHLYKPDGILEGMLERMEWTELARPEARHIVDVPPATVREVADRFREKLPVRGRMQLFGDPELAVSAIGLLPGMVGGQKQIRTFSEFGPELIVVGETHEWETNEYVRDAIAMNGNKALLILGHEASEEAGMRAVVPMLRAAFPDVETFYATGRQDRSGPIYL